jgi:UDP-glucose 4-epimerase
MRVIVTGGAGFIGSHVSEACLQTGHRVLVVDNLVSGHEKNLANGVDFKKIDICDGSFTKLIEKYKPEAIFHLAARIDVRKSVSDPLADAQVNVLGTIRLAQAASLSGCKKIIFSSTGGAIYGEQDVFPAAEDHACRPVSPYGTAKFCAENYLGYFEHSGGPACVSLRYANVYGPRQDPHGEAGVVAIFSEKMLAGQNPTVYGDGKQTRDYVFVKDVAQANLLALELNKGSVFNIGTGIETDVNRLVKIMSKYAEFSGRTEYAPARKGEQLRSCIDATKARETLGFSPKVDLETGLGQTVEFFKNNPDR